MLHACDQRFDVIGNLENFCELNKAEKASVCGETWHAWTAVAGNIGSVALTSNPADF